MGTYDGIVLYDMALYGTLLYSFEWDTTFLKAAVVISW